jgi:hypothetical protein
MGSYVQHECTTCGRTTEHATVDIGSVLELVCDVCATVVRILPPRLTGYTT